MCDPLTLGLTAASTLATGAGSLMSSNARQGAIDDYNAESQRKESQAERQRMREQQRFRGLVFDDMRGDDAKQRDLLSESGETFDNLMSLREQEARRQVGLRGEQRGVIDGAIDQFGEGFDPALASAMTARENAMTSAMDPTQVSDIALRSGAPDAVKMAFAKQMGSAFDDMTTRNAARGRVEGVGDLLDSLSRGIAGAGQRSGELQNFRDTSANAAGERMSLEELRLAMLNSFAGRPTPQRRQVMSEVPVDTYVPQPTNSDMTSTFGDILSFAGNMGMRVAGGGLGG